ncbi:DUF4910 domain-containing protein [Candidatus Pelagibacter bacterium nBUS_25]|uniref:DUF4910 domain-containing protein n=1 Tax=Candidatus Pelagibacter bacterium nBUS_25 TaxID=3374187 RepID=UPI003EBF2D57
MRKYQQGEKIYKKIKQLFPINRSLTGNGNRKSLKILQKIAKKLKILEYKSGQSVFDWKIPSEWNVKDAYVKCNGKKIIDFKKNNLHLVSYSEPVNKTISFKELNNHLHSIKKYPKSIPYITSYYKRRWGFCLEHQKRQKLEKSKNYEVYIDSDFKKNGHMSVGEILIKGKSTKEILLSTNICHPSMVNNELCAPVILAYVANYFSKIESFFSLRILFLPETIGSIAYLNKNLRTIKKKFRAGFHVTCFGDKGKFSMISTKYNNSYSDLVTKKILKSFSKYNIFKFQNCGSDERQYNFPGINLPVVTLTKTRFGKFKEYHTSKDNLSITNPKNLEKSFDFIIKIIELVNFENKKKVINKSKINNFKNLKKKKTKYDKIKIFSLTKCEPFLSKRNLYRDVSKNFLTKDEFIMFNLLYYGDGISISNIAQILSISPSKIYKIAKILDKNRLIRKIS